MKPFEIAEAFMEQQARGAPLPELKKAFENALQELGIRHFACCSHVDPLNPRHAGLVFQAYPADERLTFVANRALRPLALHCGWEAVTLGTTQPDREDEVTAIAVDVTRAGLRRVRGRFGIPGPVVRFFPPALALPGQVAA